LLGGLAGYPDEIISAVFQVAQAPECLAARTPDAPPEALEAREFLASYPGVLETLQQHPAATRAIGFLARADLVACWRTIDEIRAAESAAPPRAATHSISANETIITETTPVSFVATPVVATVPETSVSTDVHAGGVVVDADGAVHAGGAAIVSKGSATATGSAGATLVETPSGTTVAAGHAGSTRIDTAGRQSQSAHVAGIATSTGKGAVAFQQGSTTWGDGSYEHSGSGGVLTTSGAGAVYSRETSGYADEGSAGHTATTSIEPASGESYGVTHSAEATKGECGWDVDRSTTVDSATAASRQTTTRNQPLRAEDSANAASARQPFERPASLASSPQKKSLVSLGKTDLEASLKFANSKSRSAFAGFEASSPKPRRGGGGLGR